MMLVVKVLLLGQIFTVCSKLLCDKVVSFNYFYKLFAKIYDPYYSQNQFN